VDVRFLLLFSLPRDEMLSRLLSRAAINAKLGKSRDDDKKEVMEDRIALFEKQYEIFNQFKERGELNEVSGIGSINTVFNRVEEVFAEERLIKPKPKIIFVMGGPGAGKGTQCGILCEKYPELESFSCGDLLRAISKEDTATGRKIADILKSGMLCPSDVLMDAMMEYMESHDEKKVFLIDGFPRSQENIDVWQEHMAHKVDFQFLLWFDLDPEIMFSRLNARAQDNIQLLKEGKIEALRSDDKPEIMKDRI
jgi:adenylate kinase family enzyme